MKSLLEKIRYASAMTLGQPAQSPVQQLFGTDNLSQFFNAAFKTAIVIGAMLAVARLVYGGFVYMTTDLPGSKGSAKTIIGESVLGLLLLLAVWVILFQINPQILNLNILQNLPNAPATVAPPAAPSGSGAGAGAASGGIVQASSPNDAPAGSWCYGNLSGGNTCGYTTYAACQDARAAYNTGCVQAVHGPLGGSWRLPCSQMRPGTVDCAR